MGSAKHNSNFSTRIRCRRHRYLSHAHQSHPGRITVVLNNARASSPIRLFTRPSHCCCCGPCETFKARAPRLAEEKRTVADLRINVVGGFGNGLKRTTTSHYSQLPRPLSSRRRRAAREPTAGSSRGLCLALLCVYTP